MENLRSHEVLEQLFGATGAIASPSLVGELQALANKIGIKLPDAYAEFLRKIEAQEILLAHALGGFQFLRCAEALAAWQSFYQLDEEEGEVDPDVAGDTDFRIRQVVSSRGRLPIAEFNGSVWIFLDFVPASDGVVGQVIQVDVEALNWYWLADSFVHLLEEIADGRSLDPDMGTQDEDE